MGAALPVRRAIQMTLGEYDSALTVLLMGSTNAVPIALPSTLEQFLAGTPDGRNTLFRESLAAITSVSRRLTQLPVGLLAACKERLPAPSVDAAIVAMGTLHPRKPRPPA